MLSRSLKTINKLKKAKKKKKQQKKNKEHANCKVAANDPNKLFALFYLNSVLV